MKKVLIVFTDELGIGGVERSLISLLHYFDYSKYEVDLFLYANKGELYKYIPKSVNILPEVKELTCLKKSFKTKLKNGCYYSALLRLKASLQKTNWDSNKIYSKVIEKYVNKLDKDYDLAIGFLLPFDVIVKKVNAKIKVGWIHTDYSSYEDWNKERILDLYSGLDKIVAVSEAVSNNFCKLVPEYKDKVCVVENTYDKELIEELASKSGTVLVPKQKDILRLLSVGRICKEKYFERIPEICNKLKDLGLYINWDILGFGNDLNLLLDNISKYKVEDQVHYLGKTDNPYPYMKDYDVYVQPSRLEGKSVCVIEAQILGKPVIITRYKTAESQLKNGFDGLILPMETLEFTEELYKVLKDTELLKTLSENTKTVDYTNKQELEKIYNWF